MKIDMSLGNGQLYSGCQIEEVGGRMNLVTPAVDAVGIVGRNIAAIVDAAPVEDREEVTLSGPMAIWAYLVVFHAIVHRFREVRYDDGRGSVVVISRHG